MIRWAVSTLAATCFVTPLPASADGACSREVLFLDRDSLLDSKFIPTARWSLAESGTLQPAPSSETPDPERARVLLRQFGKDEPSCAGALLTIASGARRTLVMIVWVRAAILLAVLTTVASPAVASDCGARRGGAFITLGFPGGERMRVWSENDAFIQKASELRRSHQTLIPIFLLADGTDCNRRWSWHVDPVRMEWAELAIEVCDGRPSDIEADKAYWIHTVGQYCPWGLKRVGRVRHRPSPAGSRR